MRRIHTLKLIFLPSVPSALKRFLTTLKANLASPQRLVALAMFAAPP